MASARRSCRNKPDVFCYICGEYTIAPNRKPVTSFITRAFGIKLADQDKAWAPHMVCKACTETLRGWTNGKRSLNFGIPMVWREPTNHVTDCYFCAVDSTGINRGSLKYPDLQSARRPVAYCDEIPVSIFGELTDISDEDASSVEGHEDEEVILEDNAPHPFSQKELNDLVRDLNLSKDSAELLASRLKEKTSALTVNASASSATCIKRTSVFSLQWRTLYTEQILRSFCPQYESKVWRLFIDSSKLSLKCVLLHNGNQFASVPIAHSTTLKEKYEAVKWVLKKIGYDQHKWFICVDLKMVNFLLGQLSGFTKNPCFLCMWDSRDRTLHYTKKDYAELVNNMLTAFRNLGCNTSIKMHYLFSHMDRFPENLCSMSDELAERFHQDLKEMETRYHGRWDAVIMADYCWNLKRDLPATEHSRSSKKRKFKPRRLNNGEATYNLRVLTFINAHHSIYSNQCFYQVINICCWQNIFFLLKTYSGL